MKVDGFQIKVHGLVGLVIGLVVFAVAYKIGQANMLANLPFFGDNK